MLMDSDAGDRDMGEEASRRHGKQDHVDKNLVGFGSLLRR